MEDHTAMVPAPFTAPSLLPQDLATARAPLLNLLRTKTTMDIRPLIMGCRRGCSSSDAFGSSVSSGVSHYSLYLDQGREEREDEKEVRGRKRGVLGTKTCDG